LAFVRRNNYSQKKEFKLLNEKFERYIFGAFISKRISASYSGLTYKQTTEEVKLVQNCIGKLQSANNLTNSLPNLKIVILHNTNTVAMFMSPDQTFFITIHAL
jgi:hypothetical protein